MIHQRQDAIEAIREAVNECACGGGTVKPICRLCTELTDAIDMLDGADVIPPDGWSIVGHRDVSAGAPARVSARSGDVIVTMRMGRG